MGAKISKGYFSHSFALLVRWKYRVSLILAICQKIKKLYDFLILFLTQDHMGLEISKSCSDIFHPISVKLYKDIGYRGKSTGKWESMGKSKNVQYLERD